MNMYKICIVIALFSVQCMVAQEVSKDNLVRAVSPERVQIRTDSAASNDTATRSLIMMNKQATESSSVEVEDDDNNKLHLRRAISNDRALPSEIRLKRFDSDSL
jgi:hypothetical protein